MPGRSLLSLAFGIVASFFMCTGALAQEPPAGQPPEATAPPAQAPPSQDPASPAPASQAPPSATPELDQILVNLPTTLPLKKHKSYFRITHRFARDLRRGSFGQLSEDLFSLDNGAIIGLEYRFGIIDRVQAGINRSILGKTIDVFGKWDAVQQRDGHPFGFSTVVSVEGQNNLRVDPQPGVSGTVSYLWGFLALYATPTFVKDAHTPTLRVLHEGHEHTSGSEDEADASAHLDQNDTAFIGLGARMHILQTVSLVVEGSPRVYGYRPDRAAWNFGIEKKTRGHVLQLNFGNSFSTTPGQLARGGSPHDVYMGFNLSRKF